jgi:hypothetical protein
MEDPAKGPLLFSPAACFQYLWIIVYRTNLMLRLEPRPASRTQISSFELPGAS